MTSRLDRVTNSLNNSSEFWGKKLALENRFNECIAPKGDKHVHGVTNEVIRLVNLNTSGDYKGDSLYKASDDIKQALESGQENDWGDINMYHFIHPIQGKLKHRTLLEEDYNAFIGTDGYGSNETEGMGINKEVVERYHVIQLRYELIGLTGLGISSTFTNDTPYFNISCFVGPYHDLITLSQGGMGFMQSLQFLEENYEKAKLMHEEGISGIDIALFISDNDYIKVIEGKKKLGERANEIKYFSGNGELRFWAGNSSAERLASGKDLQGLIQDFDKIVHLFDQKDKFEGESLGEFITKYHQLVSLNSFLYGTNNAAEGFTGPSTGYNLSLYDVTGDAHTESNARYVMKKMSENGNQWGIDVDLIDKGVIQNFNSGEFFKVEGNQFIATERLIFRVEKAYDREIEGKISLHRDLVEYFEDLEIDLSL